MTNNRAYVDQFFFSASHNKLAPRSVRIWKIFSFSQQVGAKVSEKLEIFWIFHVCRLVPEQAIEKAIQLLATLIPPYVTSVRTQSENSKCQIHIKTDGTTGSSEWMIWRPALDK
jgi:hypothetical protein